MSTRPAAVAGLFYPLDSRELGHTVDRLLDNARPRDSIPKALVAPHAGYMYSGPVAASAYRCLENLNKSISRVILLGPAHRVGFNGVAVSDVDYFTTPLGRLPVDRDAIYSAVHSGLAQFYEKAYEQEHALEVHLPFIQRILESVSLVPLLIGRTSPALVADLLDLLWKGSDTLVVVSSDLSHFLDYESAQRIDAQTSQAIQELKGDVLTYDHACGCLPVQGLLRIAESRGLQCSILDTRNSGDTAGPKNRVVGYGAYAFHA